MTEEQATVTEKTAPADSPNKKEESVRKTDPRARKGRRNDRSKREPKEFEESIVQIDRVTRVTKGGRQLRFRVSIVIGDGKGRVGFGIGKSSEVMIGVQKAIANAKRNLITVPIFEDSIPHAANGNFKATKVLIFPAPEGKGVIAGSSVRKILELSGVKNILSKMHGSRNRLNAAYATIEALKSLQNQAPRVKKEAVVTEEANEAKKTEK